MAGPVLKQKAINYTRSASGYFGALMHGGGPCRGHCRCAGRSLPQLQRSPLPTRRCLRWRRRLASRGPAPRNGTEDGLAIGDDCSCEEPSIGRHRCFSVVLGSSARPGKAIYARGGDGRPAGDRSSPDCSSRREAGTLPPSKRAATPCAGPRVFETCGAGSWRPCVQAASVGGSGMSV